MAIPMNPRMARKVDLRSTELPSIGSKTIRPWIEQRKATGMFFTKELIQRLAEMQALLALDRPGHAAEPRARCQLQPLPARRMREVQQRT